MITPLRRKTMPAISNDIMDIHAKYYQPQSLSGEWQRAN